MRVRALILDFDGVVVDSERVLAECFVEVIEQLGGRVAIDDFGHLFGTVDADHEWERLLPQWCGGGVTLADVEAILTPIFRERSADLPVLPGVRELIDEAHGKGWRVGLGTGQGRERLMPKLERLRLVESFDAVVTRDDVTRGKPAPDTFLLVAERLGVHPSACLVVEDSMHGCQAAIAAGMDVVVCPSIVTAHLDFPAEARRVESLLDLCAAP